MLPACLPCCMLRRSKTKKNVRLQSGPVPSPGDLDFCMQLVSLKLSLPTTLVLVHVCRLSYIRYTRGRRVEAQRLSRMDERRGCDPVWWSFTGGRAKPWKQQQGQEQGVKRRNEKAVAAMPAGQDIV